MKPPHLTSSRTQSGFPPEGSIRALQLILIAGAILATGLLMGPAASAQARRIELNDYAKITTVSDPQISPDGRFIVCLVSRPNLAQDRIDRELVLIEIATGAQRVLTFDRRGVGAPRWSPTGDRIAFVAAAGGGRDDKEQIFVLPMNGGEAKRITDASNGIEQFAWKPDGAEIAYVTADEPENKKEIERHNDAFEVGDNGYLVTAAPTASHIWLVAADGAKPRRLTSGSWSLPRARRRAHRPLRSPGLPTARV
jgi:Tol biopolymer transport system component